MAEETQEKFVKGTNVGTDKIILKGYSTIVEVRPVEIFLKEDGAIGDKPSFAIVMTGLMGTAVFGQLSLETWNEALKDVGYKIVKDE
jgi:hypothetical protein